MMVFVSDTKTFRSCRNSHVKSLFFLELLRGSKTLLGGYSLIASCSPQGTMSSLPCVGCLFSAVQKVIYIGDYR